ncbi:MAG TPA: EAL domain-containing protein [Thermoanaerobaculia bacterium]|nr:EAL domain-containing protein [Thermoanaerobaculia bacterium]HUM30427.1 EAL domain-containing protein [Thermoanaerobaculia bacterium]HXK68562.1 EAL domain-containing protein [Thermoanaerobaculia bacterium]
MSDIEIRVLLIDDDEDDFIITRDLLREVDPERYHLSWVDSYDEGLIQIEKQLYEICLLDYRLGARTGLDLLREALGRGLKAPVILLTGQGDRDVDLEAMKMGAADYLVKGTIDAQTLERAIRYALKHTSTLQALAESEERYALAARGANDGLWDWNLETGEVYYSPRWFQMLGLPELTGLQKIETWLDRVHPNDINRLRAQITAHLKGTTSSLTSEHRIRHNEGFYLWVLTRGIAVRKEDGTPNRMAGSQTDISDRKLAEEKLLKDAMYDTLTGLPNRALLLDRLGVCLKRLRRDPDHNFGLLYLDIDRFKVIHDSLGHSLSDQLLISVARRLEDLLSLQHTVARPGGDEFAVLVEGIESIDSASTVADEILKTLAPPFHLDGKEIFISVSIGIAQGQAKYERAEDILRDADTAMFKAKSQGRARSVLFEIDMHESAVALLELETSLRRAVDRKEFAIHYQPIVDLLKGRIIGFETLVRWLHPTRGMILPEEFIPYAEETGLIIPIDQWVLREACRQVRTWQDSYKQDPPLMITVNLSSQQFTRSDLIETVDSILRESHLEGSSLGLEITESTVMGNPESAAALFLQLKTREIHLHIDDFGTGYSSLSYLHRFPIDSLKIDRSFVSRMGMGHEKVEIVKTIVTLAHNLTMTVMAEGVETPDHLSRLREFTCDFAQGHYFSPPMTADQATAFLNDSPSW